MTSTTEPLVAGRELDALVAEKVMGWEPDPGWLTAERHVPYYSTSIAAAWQVAEKLVGQGWSINLFHNVIGYIAKFELDTQPTAYSGRYGWRAPQSAAEAICRAALTAVDREE